MNNTYDKNKIKYTKVLSEIVLRLDSMSKTVAYIGLIRPCLNEDL
jgi:hypothetical protein